MSVFPPPDCSQWRAPALFQSCRRKLGFDVANLRLVRSQGSHSAVVAEVEGASNFLDAPNERNGPAEAGPREDMDWNCPPGSHAHHKIRVCDMQIDQLGA